MPAQPATRPPTAPPPIKRPPSEPEIEAEYSLDAEEPPPVDDPDAPTDVRHPDDAPTNVQRVDADDEPTNVRPVEPLAANAGRSKRLSEGWED
jgi:hypothetical protein